MARFVSNCLQTMRLALGRRNTNDPDSNDATFLRYLNDFVELSARNDIRIFEQFGTLQFEIDENNTTGVYTFNDVGADADFASISAEGFISLTDPPAGSVSWNRLLIFQDPGQFYDYWGVNNEDVLIKGYPTQMLYYGTEMVFRTIPNTSYQVFLYGYKLFPAFSSTGDPELPQAYYMRYFSYGAAVDYARDYRYSAEALAGLERTFARERGLILTNFHNQRKISRCQPRF